MNLPELVLIAALQVYIVSAALRTPSVIVVGAGPAGIAAATKLLEHHYDRVVVLEAENRIGGRVNSVRFGEAVIDLGAEWCHGEEGNIVYGMVKDLQILGHTDVPISLYHSSRKPIDDELSRELMRLMEEIYMPDGNKDESEGKTLGHYCTHKYNTSIHEHYQKEPEKLEVAKTCIELFHHNVLSSEGAFSWFEPSARSDYRDCGGDLNLNWNGLGYKTALEVLMKKFPDPTKALPLEETVLLNKEVIRVLWNESSVHKVVVECADNTTYEADHVIFTTSIGVLKHQHPQIFKPALPASKQEAIENIGFGAVMKIALHFKEDWWNIANFSGFQFVWSEEDKQALKKEFPEGQLKEGRSWLTDLFCIIPVEHNPKVLIAWLSGDMIPQIEKLSNETIIDGVVFVMNKFLGHQYNITGPDTFIRTFWHSNPHFRGTYSYQTVKARRSNVSAEVELSQPLLNQEGKPILHFAGEASHPYYYSTVHGAIETGHREANRIVEWYK